MRWMWEVAKRSFRRQATYRAATAAGVFTNTVFGFILAYVMLAVFSQRTQVESFNAVDAVTYIFVIQGLLMVVGLFGTTQMADRVRTGDIATDLYRPVDFQAYWLADTYGRSIFFAFFRGIPPFLVGALAFDLRLPTDVGAWLAFAGAVVLAIAVAFGWGFILQLTAFWFLDVRGPNQLGWLFAGFLGGVFVPLVFFPAWLATVARALPFRAMAQLPGEVFLGKHTGLGLVGVYAIQAAWATALLIMGRVVLSRATRRVVVQGG